MPAAYTDGMDVNRFWENVRQRGDPQYKWNSNSNNRNKSIGQVNSSFTQVNDEGVTLSWMDWLLDILFRLHSHGVVIETIMNLKESFCEVFEDLLIRDNELQSIQKLTSGQLQENFNTRAQNSGNS